MRSRVLILVALAALMPDGVSACPFCGPPPDSPGLGMMAADATVAAEVVGRKLGFSGDNAAQVVVRLKVSQVLRGNGPAAGETFAVTFADASLAPKTQRTVVTLRKAPAGWEAVAAFGDADGRLGRYLAGLAALPADPATDRIAFLLGALEDDNADIAADAHGWFASVPFEELNKFRDRLPAERLRAWLQSARVPAGRKGLYALMLSVAGAPTDAALFEKTLSGVADTAAGSGGVLAAWCRVSGRGDILAGIIADAKRPNSCREGAVRAAGFLRGHGGEPDRAAALSVLRAALAERMTFPYAVEELIRLKEWALTDDVAAAWADPARSGDGVRLFVRKYLQAIPESRRAALTGLPEAALR